MHRTLFDIGPFSIHMYGVMLAIAFWLGIELSARAAKRQGLDETRMVDLGIVVLISSVIGSRLLYVIGHVEEYRSDVLGVFRVWEGGLAFYGGLAAGVVFGIAYIRSRKVPILETIDIVAPHIALGVSITRIGCFLNGCCFGKPSSLPWACTFPSDSQAGWVQEHEMAGQAIHPTQLYSSAANFVIFLFLWKLLRRSHSKGIVFYWFLILYGLWRFAIDFIRYYEENMFLGILGKSITWNQIASIATILIGAILLVRSRSRHGFNGRS